MMMTMEWKVKFPVELVRHSDDNVPMRKKERERFFPLLLS